MNTFLRARAEAAHAPIVVLTGLADEEVAARAVREGAQDYLVKAEVDGPLLYRSIRYAVERHASDEAIRRSEALYRSLVEGSIQGVMIHVDGVIRLANQALASMLGVERSDELIGQPVWQFIAPQDRDMAQAYAKARREGRPAPNNFALHLLKRDGSRHPARLPGVVDCVGRRPGHAGDDGRHDRTQAGGAGPARQRGTVPADCREHQGSLPRRRARRLPAAVSEPHVGGHLGAAARRGLPQSARLGAGHPSRRRGGGRRDAPGDREGRADLAQLPRGASGRHHPLGAGARVPGEQRQPRALSGGRPGRGHHRRAPDRGAAAAGAEDGSRRPPGGRRGARFQQSADGHPRLQRAGAAGSREPNIRRRSTSGKSGRPARAPRASRGSCSRSAAGRSCSRRRSI